MRLYLSSFRMGDHAEHLAGLVGADGRRAVVIANALDDAPAGIRQEAVELEQAALAELGFTASELDLRDYFGRRRHLHRELARAALACVLSPSLRGLELVDDPAAVTGTYGASPLWDGLGLLDKAFIPHYQSPGHPETAAIDKVVARYQATGVAYRALQDGQALLVDGAHATIV
jgi:dipeptidase E